MTTFAHRCFRLTSLLLGLTTTSIAQGQTPSEPDPAQKTATSARPDTATGKDGAQSACGSCCVPKGEDCTKQWCRARERCRRRPRLSDWRLFRQVPGVEGWGQGALMSQDIGLRADTYVIDGADVDARTYGAMVAFAGSAAGHDGPLASRHDMVAALGAGGGGLQGEFSIDAGGGLLLPFADGFGSFARLGFGLQFLGNPYVYRSRLELPNLRLGFQVMTSDVFFELGAHGGAVLVGRYNTGEEAHRDLGADVSGGGRLTFQVERLRTDVRGLRIWSRREDPGGPVDELRSHVCVEPFEAFMLCGNTDLHRGRVTLPTGETSLSTVTYYGLTLAWGGIVVY
jgi:hypothetical protein